MDFLQAFLDVLKQKAESTGLADRISPLARSMDDLPFADGELDVIWSEGAIYNIGFETGVKVWRHYLKPGGLLVASERGYMAHEHPSGGTPEPLG